jgi:hypothetical protein
MRYRPPIKTFKAFKLLKSERGAALIQVLMISAFILAVGYFLMDALTRADQRAQNRIVKTNFMTLSDYMQQQAMDTDGLIQSSRRQ